MEDDELGRVLELSRLTYLEEQKKREAESEDLIIVESPEVIQRARKTEQIKRLLLQTTTGVLPAPLSPAIIPPSPIQCLPPPNFIQPHTFDRPVSVASYASFYIPSTSAATNIEPVLQSPAFTSEPKSQTQIYGQQILSSSSFDACPTRNIQAVLDPLKKNSNTSSSPPKVSFRNGDLIDLHSPRNASSMTIEEFDPLYHKRIEELQLAKKEEEDEEGCAIYAETSTNALKNDTQIVSVLPPVDVGPQITLTKNEKQNRQQQRRQLCCEDLKSRKELTSHFFIEKERLFNRLSSIRKRKKGEEGIFFLAPVLSYFVTQVDKIKLRVHQDHTWPRDTPLELRCLEFSCGVNRTSEDILLEVLLELLPQEKISRNGGQIPLSEYALKVFGSDEFLVEDVAIGRYPLVGTSLAVGKDVELEVGRRFLPPSMMPNMTFSKATFTHFPLLYEEQFSEFVQNLNRHFTACLDAPEQMKLRQPLLQCIKLVTTSMNKTMPVDLSSAIDSLRTACTVNGLHEAISSVLYALANIFRAYCCSSLTDFSVHIKGEQHFASKTSDSENQEKSTRDSTLCNEKFLISVETAHNFKGDWMENYKAFFLEAHLMYGSISYGVFVGGSRRIEERHGFKFVPIQLWADFDMHIPSLPRESQICFILRGIPISDDSMAAAAQQTYGHQFNSAGSAVQVCSSSGNWGASSANSNENGVFAKRLASGNLPLYDVDGFLVQGPVLVPLRQIDDSDVVQPWTLRELIRNQEEAVLLVKALEFDYRIRFPKEILPNEVHWCDFNALNAEDKENLQSLIENASSCYQLTDDDRDFLWSNRHFLHHLPRALPLVLSSCSRSLSFSWSSYSLGNIYALLQKWAPLTPEIALEMLLPPFQDKVVRQHAIKAIEKASSSEFRFNLIPQFLEALRFETFEDSALALFLLEQSKKDRRFAFELFWQLQGRVNDEKSRPFAARCQLLQQMLLELRIPDFENEIAFQRLFLERLNDISNIVKESVDQMATNTLRKELYQLSDEFDFNNLRIPIASAFRCRTLSISECAIFNSLTKPIKIVFKGRRTSFGIIYKVGDDLRQDAVVTQLVRAMNDIWLGEQLDLRMVLFRCLPTDSRKGLIELVQNCSTLREIQTQMGSGVAGVYRDDVLNNWLAKHNSSEFQFKTAIENFRRSCAGWCVATYVLGIGDRHNDNILVTTNGHVFHIDFGKYMGDWQMAAGFKRDRVPFVFTPEMAFVINGGQNTTEHFQRFIDEFCEAMNLLRKKRSILLNIMHFLTCSDIPGMNLDSLNFVENNLMLGLNDTQAKEFFTRMLLESMQSRYPRLNFFAHTIAQFKGNPLQISGMSKTDDMNRLSFISEVYTDKDDGRIDSVLVISFEKWMENCKKIYMFKLLLTRLNENVSTQIYRSFQEFQELHLKLCYRFSSRAVPILTRTTNVGRTNVRAVAVRRQVELQYFLQKLFSLSDEVAHCDLIYTFLHPIYRDTEPESRKINSVSEIWPDAGAVCQILLRITLDQQNSELRVFVGHAKNLPFVNREHVPDSYVKTYLHSGTSSAQQSKQCKRKTKVVKNTQNPTYNEEIYYSLEEVLLHGHPISRLLLHVSVWHSGNAVLKVKFALCETRIKLEKVLGCVETKKGLKELEAWFGMSLNYAA